MDVHGVQDLVRRGQVVKSPRHHPGKRGIGFHAILVALEHCYHIAKDERKAENGELLHPLGWYALANLPYKRRLRIEFDVHREAHNNLLLVVTAYQV